MNKKKTALLLGLVFGFALAGCGKQGAGSSSALSPASSGSLEASASSAVNPDSEAGSAGEASGDLPPEGTPVPEPDESLPFYLTGATDERDESTEPYNPEGLAVIPGETLNLEESASRAVPGEAVQVSSSLGLFDLTVDSVSLTEDRVEGFPAERVLRVTYTYASTDYDAELLISSLSFRLYGSDRKACAPYVLGDRQKKNVAKPIRPGESCTANIYFVFPKEASSATLVFNDVTEHSEPSEVYWELNI